MPSLKPPFRLPLTHPYLRLRSYTTSPTPSPPPPPPQPSRVGTFYRTFSYPILKTFLGALFTYQLAYYAWMKLEYVEEKRDKRGEVEGLKGELKGVVMERRGREKEEKEEKEQGGVVVVVGEEEKKGKGGGGWGSWFR